MIGNENLINIVKHIQVRKDWNDVKDNDAISYKFTQNPNLKDILIKTGNKSIIEYTS